MSAVLITQVRRSVIRRELEEAIERAIAALDAFDGDADLEPSLSASCPQTWADQRRWAIGPDDDREDQCEDEGDDADREPDCRDDQFGPSEEYDPPPALLRRLAAIRASRAARAA